MSVDIRPPEQLVSDYYASMSKFWQPVALVGEASKQQVVETIVCGKSIVIAELNGQLSAFENICRHFQAKLSLGEVNKTSDGQDVLRCKYHGWAYNIAGKCIEIPQLENQASILSAAKITKYQAQTKDGILWVCLNENPMFEIPGVEEQAYPNMKSTAVQINPNWKTSVVRMVLSALDDYHFPWLHQGVLGDREKPKAPVRTYEISDHRLVTHFQTVQPANVTNSVGNNDSTSIVDSLLSGNFVESIR